MRTGRLLAFIVALGLFAGSSCSAHPDEGVRADSKNQTANGNSAGEKTVSVSAGNTAVEIKKSGDGSKSVKIGGGAVEIVKSNKDSEKGAESTEDVVKIEGMKQHLSYECKGRSFRIEGTSNTVKLTGECQSLRVAGTSNQVDVEAVAAINVSGMENQVTWERGVNNKPPSIAKSGINNSVSKKGN